MTLEEAVVIAREWNNRMARYRTERHSTAMRLVLAAAAEKARAEKAAKGRA